MTPAQLRAFVSIVRTGSVKGAARELGISESGISMHVAQLRKELHDQLFVSAGSGLVFTPGGVRLAERAVEILRLRDETVDEVSKAAQGRRILRLGASPLFAEYAAPGLIEFLTDRSTSLEVELSVHPPERFQTLLSTRALDVTLGPDVVHAQHLKQRPFLAYDVQVVAAPRHPLARGNPSDTDLRETTWLLGPSALGRGGVVPRMLSQLGVPEHRYRIFQSEAAALAETIHGSGVTLAVAFAITVDIAAGRLIPLAGPNLRMRGMWRATTPARDINPDVLQLLHFLATPQATHAILRGAGMSVGRFETTSYTSRWS